jgi:hypothetical protein
LIPNLELRSQENQFNITNLIPAETSLSLLLPTDPSMYVDQNSSKNLQKKVEADEKMKQHVLEPT